MMAAVDSSAQTEPEPEAAAGGVLVRAVHFLRRGKGQDDPSTVDTMST